MNRASEKKPVFGKWPIQLLVCVVALLFPLVAPEGATSLGFVAVQYALFALGLNIVVGWMGLLDLGAAGFVAVGAYATAILTTQAGLPSLAALPAAMFCGLFAGVLLGVPTLRHREDYFAILTLGFAELVALTIRNWPSVTRGSFGYSGIPATTIPFVTEPLRAFPPTGFYYLALAVLVPCYFAAVWLRSTLLGRHFHLVRESETVAKSYGINVTAVKIIGFGLSAMMLAAGGFFWASYQRSIVWTEFGVLLSCLLLSLVIVGGEGRPAGVIFGAALVGTSQELLRRFLTNHGLPQNVCFLIFACGLVIFVHFRPGGILPDCPRWLGTRKKSDQTLMQETEPSGAFQPSAGFLLEVDDVAKRFDGVVAVDGLSLKIKHGECLAIIGPNGSGKSTLLNLITGLMRVDEGTIFFNGQRIDRLAAHRIAQHGIRRSFQEVSVFDDLTVEDNAYLTAGRTCSISTVINALQAFGLREPKRKTNELSYGFKKALDLARVSVEHTKIRLVFLDEPTAGLTQEESARVVSSLLNLRCQTGMAMVVVSHDIKFLDALKVDRVLVLDAGKLFREGGFAEIRADKDVTRLFWGEKALMT
jgi:branched-chain amino acid transport system permease protein